MPQLINYGNEILRVSPKGVDYSTTGGHINHGEDAFSTIVREVKEEENDRDGKEEQEDTRAARTARVEEKVEGAPVNEALDIDRQMHQPSSSFLSELADRKTNGGNGRHRGTGKSVSRDTEISADEVIHTKVNTKRNDHRIQDDG